MDLLWHRLRDWETLDLDHLAWTTRNLLELHFWTQLITEAESATAFIREAETEQGEIFRALLKQMGDLSDYSSLCYESASGPSASKASSLRGHPKPASRGHFKTGQL